MRILIYSHDTYGLGNIRRMATIAEALVEQDPASNVLIITGSPMLHAFRLSDRVDYVKLPCLNRTDVGRYDVKHLRLDIDSVKRMRAGLIATAAIDFEPDLVLVDKKPLGVMRELEPMLDILSRRLAPPHISLVLRDILDAPEVTRDVWRRNGYHEQVARFYDDILVVGARKIFDVAREYEFPSETARMIRYAGFLRRKNGKASAADIRARLGLKDEKIVLVQAGGGADGAALISTYVESLRKWPAGAPYFSWIISGPELASDERRKIARMMADTPFAFHQDFADDMNACVNAADYVVSMGGYNSVCEILSLGRPAVIVPRVRPVLEQWLRASRFADCGMIECLHPDTMTPERLGAAVEAMIANGDAQLAARRSLPLDGLPFIAAHAQRFAPPAYAATTAHFALRR